MTTENTNNWRELIDDLTPEQVAEIEHCNRLFGPGMNTEQDRLGHARALVRHNLSQVIGAGIPVPAEAIDEPSEWVEWDHGTCQRMFTAYQVQAGPLVVKILGYQMSTGEVTYEIFIEGHIDGVADSGTARVIAAALADTADKLDALSGA